MFRSHPLIFATLLFALLISLHAPAFAQKSVEKPSGPPAGHQPMATPESEGFMGYAIVSPADFELANLFLVMAPEELLKNTSAGRVPEGMLNMGAKRLMIIDLKLEKTASFNYDPMKPEGIKPKVVSFKGRLVADMAAAEEMPEVPGKAPEGKQGEGNFIEAKIYEKFIEGGMKVPVLAGTASYNGKKYDLYFNFLPPPPEGMKPPAGLAPSVPTPAPDQKPPMQIK